MKKSLTYCFIILTFSTSAQEIKLNYKPQGQVIKLLFDSLTIYTDTTSLFYIYKTHGTKGLEAYDLRVKNLVLGQFKQSKTDTATFSGDFIPFNDNLDSVYQKDWYIEWAVLHLTKVNKLKIIDKHGQVVKTIIKKKIGTKKKGYIKRSYINKDTREELFNELVYLRGPGTPAF